MENYPDPRVALIDFIHSIPKSLRIDECLFIILYFTRQQVPEDLEEFEPIVQKYLSAAQYNGLGAVIGVKALLDRRMKSVLSKLDAAEQNIKGIMKENPDFTQYPLLSMPLKKKQYAQVVERWNALSKGALSDDNIAYFEQIAHSLPPVTR